LQARKIKIGSEAADFSVGYFFLVAIILPVAAQPPSHQKSNLACTGDQQKPWHHFTMRHLKCMREHPWLLYKPYLP
jgi:hypothetical protein